MLERLLLVSRPAELLRTADASSLAVEVPCALNTVEISLELGVEVLANVEVVVVVTVFEVCTPELEYERVESAEDVVCALETVELSVPLDAVLVVVVAETVAEEVACAPEKSVL